MAQLRVRVGDFRLGKREKDAINEVLIRGECLRVPRFVNSSGNGRAISVRDTASLPAQAALRSSLG